MSRAERRARFEAKERKRLGAATAEAIQGPQPNTVRRPKRFVQAVDRNNMSRGDLLSLLEEIASQPEPDVVVEKTTYVERATAFGVSWAAAYSGALLAIVTWLLIERWIG